MRVEHAERYSARRKPRRRLPGTRTGRSHDFFSTTPMRSLRAPSIHDGGSSSQAATGLPYLSRPKVIIAEEAPSPNVIIPAIPEGPSKNVLQATQDVCDHLARMAGRVSDLFDMFDVDKNGLIDKKEFRAACLHLGITYPPDVIDQVFALLDEDGSGSLEHMEVIRTARRAAFERGFMPRVPPKPPAHQRRLNAYWARRNRMHMEAHEESVRQIEAQVSLPCMLRPPASPRPLLLLLLECTTLAPMRPSMYPP